MNIESDLNYKRVFSIKRKLDTDWKNSLVYCKDNGLWKINIPKYTDPTQIEAEDFTALEHPNAIGNTVLTSEIVSSLFTSQTDGDPVILSFNGLTIPEGVICTPTNRCKGLFLYINGDLIVNGTLSMTARGANAPGKYIGIDFLNSKNIFWSDEDIFTDTLPPEMFTVISANGGASIKDGGTGSKGVNGACAGGGCGARSNSYCHSISGNGTSFSGGAGAGGVRNEYQGNVTKTSTAGANGGAGGVGIAYSGNANKHACGGAGNPGANGGKWDGKGTGNWDVPKGQNGTGGLMILFVSGNIIIGEKGSIQSNGSNSYQTTSGWHYGGGGSGGGAIHIFCNGTINNTSKITTNGGKGGSYSNNDGNAKPGYNGGNGTLNIKQLLSSNISDDYYRENGCKIFIKK